MPTGATPYPFGDCRVCNDKATGVHYGVATCEGCKGFFKRSIPKADKYKCFFGSTCVLSPQTRNRCKACRFQRCVAVGMSVEAVKMGRIPKVDKERALAAHRNDPDCPEPSSLQPPTSSIFTPSLGQPNISTAMQDAMPIFPQQHPNFLFPDHQRENLSPHISSGDSGISMRIDASSPENDIQSVTSGDSEMFSGSGGTMTLGKSMPCIEEGMMEGPNFPASSIKDEHFPPQRDIHSTDNSYDFNTSYSGASKSNSTPPSRPLTLNTNNGGSGTGHEHSFNKSKDAASPSLSISMVRRSSASSPFSPTIIKELISQVIESGQGKELQQTLLRQFFSAKDQSSGSSSQESPGLFLDAKRKTEAAKKAKPTASGAGVGVDHPGGDLSTIKQELDMESYGHEMVHNDLGADNHFLSDLFGQPSVNLSRVYNALSSGKGGFSGRALGDPACSISSSGMTNTPQAQALMGFNNSEHELEVDSSSGSVPQDLLKYNHQVSNGSSASGSSSSNSSSSVGSMLQQSLSLIQKPPRVIMPLQPPDLAGQGQGQMTQSLKDITYSHPAPQDHHGYLDNTHENIQVDPQELEQYLCPGNKPQVHLMNQGQDQYISEVKVVSEHSTSPHYLNPHDSGRTGFQAEMLGSQPSGYLEAGPSVNIDPDDIQMAISRLESAGSSFIEQLDRNKKLMKEEQSGQRLAHPMNTLVKAKKHQVRFVWDQLMESIPICNLNVLGLCQDVPKFCNLDPKDQAILMEEGYFDIWLTMNAVLFDKDDSYLRLPCQARYSRWWMQYFLPQSLVNEMFHYTQEINKFCLTQTEIVTICAIQLTNPSYPGLTDAVQVSRLHQLYLHVLSRQLTISHTPNSASLYTAITRLLPMLSPLNKAQAEVVGKFKVDSPPEGVLKYTDDDDSKEFD